MEIDFENFKKMMNMKIIDIREKDAYNKKHLNNAINVPFQLLIIYPDKYLDKHTKYLFVCEYGMKSKKTSEILNNNGYQTFSLKGGMKKYLLDEEF